MAGVDINKDVIREIEQVADSKCNLESILEKEKEHDITDEIIKFTNWLSGNNVPCLSSSHSFNVPLKSDSPIDSKSPIPLFFISETEVVPLDICGICEINVYKDQTYTSCKNCKTLQHAYCLNRNKALHTKEPGKDETWGCDKCNHKNFKYDLKGESDSIEPTSYEFLNELTSVKNLPSILADSEICHEDLGNSDFGDTLNKSIISKFKVNPINPDPILSNNKIQTLPNSIPTTVKANNILNNIYFSNFDKPLLLNFDAENNRAYQENTQSCESKARCLFAENKVTKVKYISLYEGIHFKNPKVYDSLGFEYCLRSKASQNNFCIITWQCIKSIDSCHSILEQTDGIFEQIGKHNHEENFELYINALRFKAIENSPIVLPNLDLQSKFLNKSHIVNAARKKNGEDMAKNSYSSNLSKSVKKADTIKVNFNNTSAPSYVKQEYTNASSHRDECLYVEDTQTKIQYVSLSKGSLNNTPKVYDSLGYGYTLRTVGDIIVWRCCKSGGNLRCRAILHQANGKFCQLVEHNHRDSNDAYAVALERKAMEKSPVVLPISILKGIRQNKKVKLPFDPKNIETEGYLNGNTHKTDTPSKMLSKTSVDSTFAKDYCISPENKLKQIIYISLRKGSRFIYDSLGYVYCLSKKAIPSKNNKTGILWECGKVITKKCLATLMQSDGNFHQKGQHSHGANIAFYNNALRCSHEIVSNTEVKRNLFSERSPTYMIYKSSSCSNNILIKDLENNNSFDHINNSTPNSFNKLEQIDSCQPCLREENFLYVENEITEIRYVSLKCGTVFGNPKVIDNLGYGYTIRKANIRSITWQCTLCNGKGYCPVTLFQIGSNFEQNGKHNHHKNSCNYVQALQRKVAEKSPVFLTFSDLEKNLKSCKNRVLVKTVERVKCLAIGGGNMINKGNLEKDFSTEISDTKIKYVSLRNGTCFGNPKVCSSLGFEYTLKTVKKDIIRWQCLHGNGGERCSAMLHQINGNFEQQGVHKHEQNVESYLKALSYKASENSPIILSHSILNSCLQLQKLKFGCSPDVQNSKKKRINFQQIKLENTSETNANKLTDNLIKKHSDNSNTINPVPAHDENRYGNGISVSYENNITKIKYVSLKNGTRPKIYDSLGFEYVLKKARKLTNSVTWCCIHGNIRRSCNATLLQIDANLELKGEHNHSNNKGNYKKALMLKAGENSPTILPPVLLCEILDKKSRFKERHTSSNNLSSRRKGAPQKHYMVMPIIDFEEGSNKQDNLLESLPEIDQFHELDQSAQNDNIQERPLNIDQPLELNIENNFVKLHEPFVKTIISQKNESIREKSLNSAKNKDKCFGKILKNYNSNEIGTKNVTALSHVAKPLRAKVIDLDAFYSKANEEDICGREKSFGSCYNFKGICRSSNNLSNLTTGTLDLTKQHARITNSLVNASSTDVFKCHLNGEQESAITKIFLNIINIGYPIKPLTWKSFLTEGENQLFMDGAKFYFEKMNFNAFSLSTLKPLALWLKKFLLDSTLLSDRFHYLINISSSNISSSMLDSFYHNFEKLLKENYWEDPYQYLSINNSHLIFFCDSLELSNTPILNEHIHDKSVKKINVLCCISGSGQSIHPLTITKSSVNNNCANNVKKFDKFLTSSSCDGNLNGNIFHFWLLQFDDELVKNELPRPVVVFLNGDNAHISFESIQFSKNRNILLYFIPPNSSFLLNPLKISVFPSLKENFKKMIVEDVDNDNLPYIFVKAFEKLQLAKLSQAGFKKAGLCPFSRLMC